MTHYLALATAIIATSAGHLTYRMAFLHDRRALILVAAATFCIAPIAALHALSGIGVGTVYLSTALAQVLILAGSVAFLGERPSRRALAAITLIVAGLLVYAL